MLTSTHTPLLLAPADQYAFRELVRLVKLTELARPSERTLNRLRERFFDYVVPLLHFAQQEDGERFYPTYVQLKSNQVDEHVMLNERIDTLAEALELYIQTAEQAVYPTLLDRPVGELTGYEYGILMRRLNG